MSATEVLNPIVEAASRMLGRGDDGGLPVNKNDVGFNRFDYPLVRNMLASIERQGGEPTRGQLRGLLTVLGKYKRQLGELGYEADALAAAVADGSEQPPTTAIRDAVRTGSVPSLSDEDDEDEEDEEDVSSVVRVVPRMADILGSSGPIAKRLPGYEPRPPQIEIAQNIADAIDDEKSILAEAGTGVGKSLAYLIPAILSGQKAIVSTEGKALQDQLSGKDLPFLKTVLAAEFDYAVLKGIGNYVCWYEYGPEAQRQQMMGESHEFAQLRNWVDQTHTGDLAEAPIQPNAELRAAITTTSDDCLGKECPFADQCFYLKARANAEKAQIVVVNHTLLTIDLAVRDMTDDGASVLPDRDLVIVDEAHSLEDVATKAFTDELTEFAVSRLLSGKRAKLANIERDEIDAAKDASDALFNYIKKDERQSFLVAPTDQLRGLGANLVSELRPFKTRANMAATDASKDADRRALERYADRIDKTVEVIRSVTGLSVSISDEWIIYAETERGRFGDRLATLKRAPVSLAEDLRRALWNKWPVVATSATLSTGGTFDYIRERTGCDRARAVSVESPFDYKRNALIYLPQDGRSFDPTLYRQDGSVEYLDRLGHEIERLLLASDGRAFCLFTSRKAMDEVYQRIAHRLRWTVLKQGDYSTRDIVHRFKSDGHAVLFGLRSFWTGVDVQGEALSLVIVDKLPFPTPDEPVHQARCDLLNKTTGDKWAWFTRLALPMATMQFKQGAGRLIRSKTDRGVLALLDGRLTTKGYGTGIIRSLPPATTTRSVEAVQAFFATA